MADFESIVKGHANAEGIIPAEDIGKVVKAINTAVGNEFVDKKRYKDKLEEIETLKAEKQTAEDNVTTSEKWKEKHDKIKKEFDDYKSDITAKESKAAKEKAVRAYYESKGITGKNLNIAMKGSAEEVNAIELDGDKIKDTSVLDTLISDTFSELVSTTETRGANTSHPPANTGGKMSKDDIFKIKDSTERQNAIAANIDIFRKDT